MGQLEVDASNSCIPPNLCAASDERDGRSSSGRGGTVLVAHVPPLPRTVRGEPAVFAGRAGRINSDRPVVLYGSGRLVVVRELDGEIDGADADADASGGAGGGGGGGGGAKGDGGGVAKWKGGLSRPPRVRAFVYRGHTSRVTAASFSPSGCYVASADDRGRLRVWSYDNQEHLCKLELGSALSGPIRDLGWDFESKRICIVGEGSKTDASSVCARVIQWDTGVTCGDLAQHTRNRAVSCAFKPSRPMRIATGGGDDSRVLFNKGPPFARMVDGEVAEQVHTRGAVHCVRYSPDGAKIVSVGTDKSVVFYDGKTMALIRKMEDVHKNSIYGCDWSSDSKNVVTCSADGTVKLIDAATYLVVHTWDVASLESARIGLPSLQPTEKVPVGAMQMGCAFVRGDIPVSVGLNGQIAILPVPAGLIAGNSGEKVTSPKLLSGHQAPISAFAIDSNVPGRLYTGDTDGVICAWNLFASKAVGRIQLDGDDESVDVTLMDKVHGGAITCMAFVGGTLISAGWDDTLRLGNGAVVEKSIKVEAQPNAMSRGGELVVVITVGGLLLLKDNEVASELIILPYAALSVCVSVNDSTVVVGGEDCTIHVYSVETPSSSSLSLKEVHKIENGHLKPVHALALSHDGTLLASADVRDVCVWSVDGWSPVIGKSRWCFHTQRITCLAWSNDDSVLASGGNDDSIYLWSLKKKMKRVHYPFAHRGGVTALEFLKGKDGMVLVSAGCDSCVNQWDVTDDVAQKFG